jgi:ankyrin repeat protein
MRYKEKDYSDVNIVNSKGQTLLAYAISQSHHEIIAKLMELKAPLYATNVKESETVKDCETFSVDRIKEFFSGEPISARVMMNEKLNNPDTKVEGIIDYVKTIKTMSPEGQVDAIESIIADTETKEIIKMLCKK